MKNKEKEEARLLRKSGLSIKEIAKKLKVSTGSVSLWVKDIQLTTSQILQLQLQNPIFNNQLNGVKTIKNNAYQQRINYQNIGKTKAKEKNLLHMAGCMLYWAEGAKHRSACIFCNSDLIMIKFYLKFLRECFNIQNDMLKIHINCYTNNGLTIEEIESYWQNELNLPKSCFGKTTADNLSKYSQKKKAKNKLLYGTLKIKVLKSVWLVQHIYGAIQEYTGVHNNYGLDL